MVHDMHGMRMAATIPSHAMRHAPHAASTKSATPSSRRSRGGPRGRCPASACSARVSLAADGRAGSWTGRTGASGWRATRTGARGAAEGKTRAAAQPAARANPIKAHHPFTQRRHIATNMQNVATTQYIQTTYKQQHMQHTTYIQHANNNMCSLHHLLDRPHQAVPGGGVPHLLHDAHGLLLRRGVLLIDDYDYIMMMVR